MKKITEELLDDRQHSRHSLSPILLTFHQTDNHRNPAPMNSFEVYVSKDTFKFNAAHFVAFQNYRERLHGHNYKIGVRLLGDRQGGGKIGPDGYVIDFGNIKAVCKQVCKRLNEHFLCPMYSDVLKITLSDDDNDGTKGSVRVECQDGTHFVFPKQDCMLLPIVHATTEELGIYLWSEILHGLHAPYLLQRGIHTMEVTVAEAPGQEATFRHAIPTENSATGKLDVRHFIMEGDVIPMPCPTESDKTSKTQGTQSASSPCSCPDCGGTTKFSEQLQQLAAAINNGRLQSKGPISAQDLEKALSEQT